MADLDLWTEHSTLSNFADDTQSLCIAEDKETAISKTITDASNIISFFTANDLVSNADKTCVIYNAKGKGQEITLENIGGEKITSLQEDKSEKLLGLQVSNEFNWKLHVDQLITDLNKK